MQASDVQRAVAAAISTAAALGLESTNAIVLQNSNRVALRLLPCDVLARVAPVAHQVAQFEVELAQRLAEAGCPVGSLEPRVDPLVYARDGFEVTLWAYYEPVTPHVSPAVPPARSSAHPPTLSTPGPAAARLHGPRRAQRNTPAAGSPR